MFRRWLCWWMMVVAMVSVGCATDGQRFSGVEAPVGDQGDIYLYRTSALYAIGQPFEVKLDGEKAGELNNASYLYFRLAPGKHTLKVYPGGLSKSSELTVEVEPGKTAFYQYGFPSGLLSNTLFIGSSIEPRERERALRDLAELRLSR